MQGPKYCVLSGTFATLGYFNFLCHLPLYQKLALQTKHTKVKHLYYTLGPLSVEFGLVLKSVNLIIEVWIGTAIDHILFN